ncbi:MAG: hypothetical protein HYR74_08120 [Candidatus Eisenbacteria bacterium]|nr:hypothetical protein [Candidatus Eisenbacteria bacterium]
MRLVAGSRHDDAGIRLAELCGLPRSVDLADLTREIFDLALVSERSPRRTQVEGLLLALGTPSVTPQAFLSGEGGHLPAVPAVEAPLALHVVAFESTVGGNIDALLAQALPDVADETRTAPEPVAPSGRSIEIQSLEDFPSLEDRRGLEHALTGLMQETGAGRAEIHLVGPDALETLIEVGPTDGLLKGLVQLADHLGTPQVVGGLVGAQEGKAWGAWPFRTPQRRGVVAAAGIDRARGWSTWEKTVDDLRRSWDRLERERAGPAFPMLPDQHPRWLAPQDLSARLDLAVERNRRDGLRFAVHRLTFPGSPESVGALCDRLPGQLRDTDCMAHPSAQSVVLLTAGAPDAFSHLRRRLLALWDEMCHAAGGPRSAEGVTDEQVSLICPADSPAFLATARAWIAGGGGASPTAS